MQTLRREIPASTETRRSPKLVAGKRRIPPRSILDYVHALTPHLDNIPSMSIYTVNPRGSCISFRRIDALDHLDVGGGHRLPIVARDPVLRTRVAESEYGRRELGDDVVGVRHTEETALRGDILGQGSISHSGTAVCVLNTLSMTREIAGVLPARWYARHFAKQ